MMNTTDCDVRFASHARQIARVNASEWLRPEHVGTARVALRARLGTMLIALGSRLTPVTQDAPADPVLASGNRA